MSEEETNEINIQKTLELEFEAPPELSLRAKLEAILFASPKPMKAVEINELLNPEECVTKIPLEDIQAELDSIEASYKERVCGFHLVYLSKLGYQFQTVDAAKPLMERQFASRPRPLSKAALETLAIIAYRQKKSKGVTRAEVEFIRGVDAGNIFKSLVERELLTCIGRKEIPGRPLMFAVTPEFLRTFQMNSIHDLPSLESFQMEPETLRMAQEKINEFEKEQSESTVDVEEFMLPE